jgi:hypothetical protein
MALIEWKTNEWINDSLVDRVTYTREEKPIPRRLVDDFMEKPVDTETVHTLTIYLSRDSADLHSPHVTNDAREITRLAKLLGIHIPIKESFP